ncbi:hypothetical protein GOFOIKOB_3684 [Methylobacterium tardum]|uniref:Uncharacterized protein n=1 Tax=Methylobacterium tardum TaxID=374432 RepID=A0AA37T9C3_9HYPH|nr:hypothetical protein [Methylobacterium tardum]GJE50634.1 hypothetical protein GOFOIKOB_3684 [Methylobacterium tardum]GLS69261.1 hypothetical protein GCM10007890_12730 [Methylobacterium tardum]
MPQTYALQIPVVAVAVSAPGLGGLFVAARIYDRNTRKLEARQGD